MGSNLFRTSPRPQALAFALFAAVLASGAAPQRSPADLAAQLTTLIRTALSQAPSNFVAWRAGTKSSDAYGVTFKQSAGFKQICPSCNAADEYATADTDERYAVTFDWLVPNSWSRAQTLAYIELHIGELLPSYTASQGTHDGGENWFDWSKGSPTQFVHVRTFSGKTGNGFEVRVGHYLKTSLHYTPYARLSATQRGDLGKAVRNFVQLGIQNGSDNFLSLRGPATDKDNNYFDTSVLFGEYMTGCTVDGIFANESASGGTSKWILECDTPSLGGTKDDVEAVIRTAVAGALPDGFVPTTDSKYLGTNDFRWDRSTDSIAVEVWAYDNGDQTFDYHVEVYHFTT